MKKSNLKKLIMPLGFLIIVLSIVFLSDGLSILGVIAGVLIVVLTGEEELKKSRNVECVQRFLLITFFFCFLVVG